jgi:hypothetical protein
MLDCSCVMGGIHVLWGVFMIVEEPFLLCVGIPNKEKAWGLGKATKMIVPGKKRNKQL